MKEISYKNLLSFLKASSSGIIFLEPILDEKEEIQDFKVGFANKSSLDIFPSIKKSNKTNICTIYPFFKKNLPDLKGASIFDMFAKTMQNLETTKFEISFDEESRFTYLQFECIRVEDGLFIKVDNVTKESIKKRELYLKIEQSRTENIRNIVGSIMHQWKQPVNIISLVASTIEDDLDNRDELIKSANEILNQVDFMSKTANELRNFFSTNREKEKFNPKTIVEDTLKLLSTLLNRDYIEVNISQDKIKNKVEGYPNELKQVIINIINNAIEVFSERKIKKPKIEIFFEENEQKVAIHFRDNGGGIEQNLLPDKIFEEYFTTKKGLGTGIGLSLSKRVIHDHMGGTLSAKNTNDGAQFSIELLALQE